LSYDLSQKSLNRYENEAYNAKVEESVAKWLCVLCRLHRLPVDLPDVSFG
jgi:hypothetical protein